MWWRVLCVIQFCGLLAIYTYLGLTPHPEKSVPMFNDLLMHFSGYIVAAVSISFAFPSWAFLQRAIFLVTYSFLIELGQHFNPPRTFSLADMLANSSGVILGLCVIFILAKYVTLFAKLLYWKTNLNNTIITPNS
ncbi:MAG: hypothetical protein B0W54_07435 [Cellvibrio sp. 79]|nr:MAG: hypothetical protein B0W54_07435 [Cellvibrio sp. 79]